MIRAAFYMLASIFLLSWQAEASCSGTGCYCTVNATAVSFGTYNALTQQAVDSTGNVEISCGSDTIGDSISYLVSLSMGENGKKTDRKMASGRNTLLYNLYTDVTHTAIWADGAGGTSVVSDGYTLSLLCCEIRNYTVYGRIAGGQNAAPGLYSDAIIVTVEW